MNDITRRQALLVLGGLLAAGSRGIARPQLAAVRNDRKAKASRPGTSFALDLYGELRDQPGNLFLSPFSISMALAMTYAGARGDTESQMADVLHFDPEREAVHSRLQALRRRLEATAARGGHELTIANALWIQKDYPFAREFLGLVGTRYDATLRSLDFVADPAGAVDAINAWVEEKTTRKISRIVSPGDFRAMVKLVLTNAIYFKGEWAWKFDKAATKPAPFRMIRAKHVEVPLMFRKATFGYLAGDGFQALELAYEKGDLSMVVFLPDEVGGLRELERELTAEKLERWLGRLRKREVKAYLPRFRAESSFDLGNTLKALGMQDAFGRTANFSAMSEKSELYIHKVLHKAHVDVNEKGSEAAAATAVIMVYKSPGAKPPIFRADHPFLFLIRERSTGSILFLGRLSDPSA